MANIYVILVFIFGGVFGVGFLIIAFINLNNQTSIGKIPKPPKHLDNE